MQHRETRSESWASHSWLHLMKDLQWTLIEINGVGEVTISLKIIGAFVCVG